MHHLKTKGDLPHTLVKDFTHGFSHLCECFEGMLRIRYSLVKSVLTIGILPFRCVIVFTRVGIRKLLLINRRQVMIMYCSSLPFSLVVSLFWSDFRSVI